MPPDFAWNLFTELRKELVELQRIRSQIFGFKIAFIGGFFGVLGERIRKDRHII